MWPADGGANRAPVCSGADYPNDLNSWVVYGPFDLSDASQAGTEFVMWHEIEPSYDAVCFGVSENGTDFSVLCWDGYADCTLYDIPYTDYVGDPSVWVAWIFISDYSITYRGPWVDDVIIWKQEGMTMRIAPPMVDANAGADFSIDVAIVDAVDLGAFEFSLLYDPSCVGAVSVDLGPFLGSTGRTAVPVGPTFDAESVTFGAYSFGSPTGPNGEGVLATVHFTAGASECSSLLHLQNAALTDTAGNPRTPTLQDGYVNVIAGCNSDCPEDINGDGVIDIRDVQLVVSKWGQSCPTR
jgi:hypothetical protein